MSAAARLIESLKIRPDGSVTIDSMIESLLASALNEPVSYVIEHTTPSSVTARVGSDACNETDRGLLRTFRTLLARMSYMLAQENGTEFNPYGGDLVARRYGVELAIHFENTTVSQGLAITRSTAPLLPEPHAIPSGRNGLSERSLSQPQVCES